VGVSLVVAGSVLPAIAWPLAGVGVAMVLGLSTTRRAIAGCTVGLTAAAAFLPSAQTTVQRTATMVVIGWALASTMGWRRAIRARHSAETAVDTVMLGAAEEPTGQRLIRTLTDILGGTGARFDSDAIHITMTSWDKSRKTVLVPLVAGGRPAGTITVQGVSRPDPWQLDLAGLVAARCAEQVVANERAERLPPADAVDPITGLGNERAVASGLSSLEAGDSVITVRLEDLAALRAAGGDDRADLLVCQLGLHVRNRLRATDIVARYGDDRFVVICRHANGETSSIVDRLLSAWPVWEAGHQLLAIAAVHHDGRSAVETLDAALDPVGRQAIDFADDAVWAPAQTSVHARAGQTVGN
jgi:GGDEF domain-containing protein